MIQSLVACPALALISLYGLFIDRTLGFLEGRYFEAAFMLGAGYALMSLLASVFLPPRLLRPGAMKWLLGTGLALGVASAGYLMWMGGGISLRDELDAFIAWCLFGPTAVALWNLVSIVRLKGARLRQWPDDFES